MQVSTRTLRCLLILAVAVVGLGMDCQNMNPNGNTNANNNNNNNNNSGASSRLFVVNNNSGVTSYENPATNTGNVTPATDLPVGAATNIFQPRSLVVTMGEQLIVARQNGGLSIHDNALTATGATAADRTVEGAATLMDTPIALAYDAANDRLFVGTVNSDDGILVYDDVSDAAFTGNLAPDRKFNPPDRAPTNTTSMTIDALALDANGTLYVSDSSGLNVNSSRILVFQNPGAANGETAPDRTISSLAWGGIEDLFVDDDDNLYVLDGGNEIEVIDPASTANGIVLADRTISVNGANVGLRGILVDGSGRGFAADFGNDEILILLNIATLNGARDADATIAGNDTELATPRHMFLVPG